MSDSQDIHLFKLSFDFLQAFIAVVGFNPFSWKSPTPGGVDSSLFVGEGAPRSCTKDEGRSFEVGLQEQASNHLKLLWLKAIVVSVNCATKLQRRWREALRSRPAGGGFKPPQAAVGKSHGSER